MSVPGIPAGSVPILGQNTPMEGNLSNIEAMTGVTPMLMPIVTLQAEGEYEGRPVVLVGQITAGEFRKLALQWMAMAFGVDHDAAVAQELVISAKISPVQAVAFVDKMNKRRQGLEDTKEESAAEG